MEEIYNILKEIRPAADFRNSKNFIEDGLLDSFDIVSLVSAIEEKYKVNIVGESILVENFISAQAIKDLIKKRGGKI